MRIPITINDDGTVTWHGVSTGKTRVLDINRKAGLIALHVAGHTYWSGREQLYSSARVHVHTFEETDDPRQIYVNELFGELEWMARGNKWRPEQ